VGQEQVKEIRELHRMCIVYSELSLVRQTSREVCNLVMPRTFAPANCWLCHTTQNSASEWASRLVAEKYPLNTAKEELVLFLYDGNVNFDAKDNIENEN
jgi:hypothetical protein